MTLPFKVLAIDGGGIKGLFSAQVLAEIERARGRISDYFDLICGTSTGGLIALALGAGKSSAEIVDFYLNWGPKIFHDKHWSTRLWTGLHQFLLSARYGDTILRAAAESLLEGKLMSESKTRLCITSVDLTENKPVVFKTKHAERLAWPDLTMTEVALATAAAPTFFPAARLTDMPTSAYADGGLFANNPAMVGLIEALRFFVGPRSDHKTHHEVWILSIASMTSPKVFPKTNKRSLSALDWMNPVRGAPLINALMDTQARSTVENMKMLSSSLDLFQHYIRVEPPTLADAQLRHFKLHNARSEALTELEKHGKTTGRAAASQLEVRQFFETKSQPPIYY